MDNVERLAMLLALYSRTHLQSLEIINVLMDRCDKHNLKLEKSLLDDVVRFVDTSRELQKTRREITSL